MEDNELIAKFKEQMLRNRLRLAKGVAITTTVVAAYYLGKSRGPVTVHLYPRNPHLGPVDPIASAKIR